MKTFLFRTIITAVLLLSGCSKLHLVPGVPVRDGFESAAIGDLWETDKILPADVKMQSAFVRSGKSALQITLHTSDHFEAGRDGDKDSERAELTESKGLMSQEGKTYLYAFSMFIPADFPMVARRLVIAQWKQECPRGRKCSNNSPVLAIRYVSGVLSITQNIGAHHTTLWKSQEDFHNRWLDFTFRICFTPNADGRITAHLNDSLLVNYTGPTTYQEDNSTGYVAPGRFYFKMGLYRDTMAEPMTIYIDDYRKELIDIFHNPTTWESRGRIGDVSIKFIMAAIPDYIVLFCWIFFFAYWIISARRVKATAERQSLWSALAHRIPLGVSYLLLAAWNGGAGGGGSKIAIGYVTIMLLPAPMNLSVTSHAEWAMAMGGFICVLGLFMTLWARWTLAGNWSSDVTFKQGHELIRRGPYRLVRHPIYTGLLTMCLGTAIEIGRLRGWLALPLMMVALWIKLKQEEALMLRHFPDEYPGYQKQVKALVPFVI